MTNEDVLRSLLEIGLSEEPKEMVVFTDEPKIPGYISIPNKVATSKYDWEDVYGQGYSFDRTLAKVKSVAELLERLCIMNPQKTNFVESSASSDNFVDPTLFVHYSKDQLKDKEIFLEKVRKGTYKWWPAYDYFKNKSIVVPGQQIFLSDDFVNEVQISGEQITTGAALGNFYEKNILRRGLMEVVERDSFMIAYLRKKKVPEISNFTNEVQNLIEYLDRYRLETHVYDITSDLRIATFMTIVLDRTGLGTAVNVGLRSSYDYQQTITESILESIQSRRTSRYLLNMGDVQKIPSENEVKSMETRYYYWYLLEMIKYLDFWLNDTPKVAFDKLPKYHSSLEETLDELKSRDYHLLLADITIPEVKKAGFEVVKVLVPELHPLYLSEHAKALYSIHAGTIGEDKSLKPHPFA